LAKRDDLTGQKRKMQNTEVHVRLIKAVEMDGMCSMHEKRQ